MLTDIARRLELKGQKFSVFMAASDDELNDLWTSILSIDQEFSLSKEDKVSAKDLPLNLTNFISHCCKQRHYFFDILKCGKDDCEVCLPPRLPTDVFRKLNHLPDPVPGSEGHYKQFADLFGTKTSEGHRPSSQRKSQKQKSLPFYPSVQHVKNTEMMLLCEECEMWRLVYSKRKLKKNEREELEGALDGMLFSCGAQLQDADIPMYLKDVVYVRQMSCEDPIEKLYYSAKFEDICVYCAASVPPWSDTEPYYPQCSSCADKQPIPNAKKSSSKT